MATSLKVIVKYLNYSIIFLRAIFPYKTSKLHVALFSSARLWRLFKFRFKTNKDLWQNIAVYKFTNYVFSSLGNKSSLSVP